VAPPSNKAAAKPIHADLVMIFSTPIPRPPAKEHPTGTGRSQAESLTFITRMNRDGDPAAKLLTKDEARRIAARIFSRGAIVRACG
jgi:hypothetical protein